MQVTGIRVPQVFEVEAPLDLLLLVSQVRQEPRNIIRDRVRFMAVQALILLPSLLQFPSTERADEKIAQNGSLLHTLTIHAHLIDGLS